jgi:hypothetical protein
MGLDLKLLISNSSTSPDFCPTLIDCHREGEFFEELGEIEDRYGTKLEHFIVSYTGSSEYYDDVCFGETFKSLYGEVIKGVEAKHIKNVSSYKSFKNEAAIKYIKCLPDDLVIYFYWS